MRLIFPGTKGEIEEESPEHRFHSNLLIYHKNTSLIIDLGEKYSPELYISLNKFDAMLITHAHPDHYIWTKRSEDAVNIPVYLTEETLNYTGSKPVNFKIIKAEKEFNINDINICAYNVIHSLRCPAVCYRIKGNRTLIYAPDILDIESPKELVFKGVDVLIADGSSVNVNMVRRRDDKLFGHAMIKTIVNWCKKYNIKRLLITHCGKQIVTGNKREIEEMISAYSEGAVDWQIAYDGFEVEV